MELMFTEIAKLAEWQDVQARRPGEEYALVGDGLAVTRVMEHLNAAIAGYAKWADAFIGEARTASTEPIMHALAKTALWALIGLHHYTGDAATDGAILFDAIRHEQRRMTNATVQQRRNAVRETADALAAQRQFRDAADL